MELKSVQVIPANHEHIVYPFPMEEIRRCMMPGVCTEGGSRVGKTYSVRCKYVMVIEREKKGGIRRISDGQALIELCCFGAISAS